LFLPTWGCKPKAEPDFQGWASSSPMWSPQSGFSLQAGLGADCSFQGDLVEAPGWTSDREAIPAGRELRLTEAALLFISEETVWSIAITAGCPLVMESHGI